MDVVQLFLAAGILVNARGRNGDTALIHAVAEGFSEIAGILIKNGADVNATSKDLSPPSWLPAMKVRSKW